MNNVGTKFGISLFSLPQVSALLQVGEDVAVKLALAGHLDRVKVGASMRYTAESVERVMRRKVSPDQCRQCRSSSTKRRRYQAVDGDDRITVRVCADCGFMAVVQRK
jgi:hypothetical protein